jgi:hypothetical protein
MKHSPELTHLKIAFDSKDFVKATSKAIFAMRKLEIQMLIAKDEILTRRENSFVFGLGYILVLITLMILV